MLRVAGPALRASLFALAVALGGAGTPAQADVAPKVRAYDVKVRASFDLQWTRGAVGQPCTNWTYETGSTNAEWRNRRRRGTRVYILSFPGKAIEFRGAVESSGDASRKWTQRIETTSSPGCPTACTPKASGSSGGPVAHTADPIGPCTSSPQSEPEPPKTDCGKRSVTKSWSEFKVDATKQPDGRSVQLLQVFPPPDLLGWARCPTASKPSYLAGAKPGPAAVSVEELLLLKRGKRLRFENSGRQVPCKGPVRAGSCTYDWDLAVTVTRRAGRPGTR